MTDSKKKYFYINSLEKGIRVLELLADKQELTVTKVAECLGLNRTGSHRFLATLRELGYAEKTANNRYQLTFKILELGMKSRTDSKSDGLLVRSWNRSCPDSMRPST